MQMPDGGTRWPCGHAAEGAFSSPGGGEFGAARRVGMARGATPSTLAVGGLGAGVGREVFGVPLPGPVFLPRAESRGHRVAPDVGRFRVEFREMPAQAVVEISLLPDEARVAGVVFFPIANDPAHRCRGRETQQGVPVIGH